MPPRPHDSGPRGSADIGSRQPSPPFSQLLDGMDAASEPPKAARQAPAERRTEPEHRDRGAEPPASARKAETSDRSAEANDDAAGKDDRASTEGAETEEAADAKHADSSQGKSEGADAKPSANAGVADEPIEPPPAVADTHTSPSLTEAPPAAVAPSQPPAAVEAPGTAVVADKAATMPAVAKSDDAEAPRQPAAAAAGKPGPGSAAAAPGIANDADGVTQHDHRNAQSQQHKAAGEPPKAGETGAQPHKTSDDASGFKPADAALAKAGDVLGAVKAVVEAAPTTGAPAGQPGTVAQAATAHAAATAAPPTPVPVPVPMAGLAVEIASRALAGKQRFEIRLDPPELGRIDVRLDVDREGRVTSRLVVERAETLDLLRRDAAQLERALQQAGLKTSDHSLEFSLRQDSAGREEAAQDGTRIAVSDDDPAPLEALRQGYGRLLGLGGGLDIRV